MANTLGRLHACGIAKESSRGTGETSASYWLKPLDLKIDNKTKFVNDEQALARIEGSDGMTLVEKSGEVTIKEKLHEQSLGLILLALLGTDTPAAQSAPNAAAYDHLFSVANNNQHQCLTIFHKSPNDDVKYSLGMIESFKLECKPDGYPTYEAVFQTKANVAASSTVAHITEKDFLAKHLTFKLADTQSGLAAASAVKIRSFSMEVKKNLFQEYNLGSNTPNDIANQTLEISGQITLMSAGSTYSDLQNNETNKAMRFDFVHTDTIATSAHPELKIDLYKCRFSNYSRSIGMNALVEETFDFTALFDQTTGKSIEITLTNLLTAY